MDRHRRAGPAATAADVMTEAVVSVLPETRLHAVARVLLRERPGALPVVDRTGVLVGFVGEADLQGRRDQNRLAGQEGPLAIVSGNEPMVAAPAASAGARQAREVTRSPVVTVDAGMPVHDVAETLRSHGVKHVPVTRAGRMIGIVSRVDLRRAPPAPTARSIATSNSRCKNGLRSRTGVPAAEGIHTEDSVISAPAPTLGNYPGRAAPCCPVNESVEYGPGRPQCGYDAQVQATHPNLR